MPTYEFERLADGRRVEVVLSIAELTERTDEDGAITLEDGAKAKRVWGVFRTQEPGAWPMASEAAGCHPSEVGEYMDVARKRGVPTSFTADGRPIFRSREHRKRFCKAFGFFDKDAGYSDATPD